MNSKIFSSENKHEIVETRHFVKSHKALFFLRSIDNIFDTLNVVTEMITYLKEQDIKWVIIKIPVFRRHELIVPTNSVWFQNKITGDMNIHIEDFVNFFKMNFIYFVHDKNVYIPPRVDNDGWMCHIDFKKEYDTRFKKLQSDFQIMNKPVQE